PGPALRLAGGDAFFVDRNRNDIAADQQPVTMGQPVRSGHALAGAVDEGPVARDVVKPEGARLVAHLAMPGRDELVRIGERPVAILAADLEAAIARGVVRRVALGQPVDLADLERHEPPEASPHLVNKYL